MDKHSVDNSTLVALKFSNRNRAQSRRKALNRKKGSFGVLRCSDGFLKPGRPHLIGSTPPVRLSQANFGPSLIIVNNSKYM